MRDPNDPGTLDLMMGGLLIGYARVSTDDQDLSHQRAELHEAGCPRIYARSPASMPDALSWGGCWTTCARTRNAFRAAARRRLRTGLHADRPGPGWPAASDSTWCE